MSSPLEDILSKRGKASDFYGHTHNFIELFGGKAVLMSFYEPNPDTTRDSFYYNTRENRLFKKLRAVDRYVWKPVSSD
jgi:hypothetical protein